VFLFSLTENAVKKHKERGHKRKGKKKRKEKKEKQVKTKEKTMRKNENCSIKGLKKKM